MARDRDLLVNFERMRREMDELFGGVWGGTGWRSSRTQTGFSPRVDVYYCDGEPPQAIVKVELAGVSLDSVEPRDRGARARDQRRAAGAGDRGPRLPAGRDRGRPVPPSRRAERRRGRRGGQGHATRTASSASSCRCARGAATSRRVPIEPRTIQGLMAEARDEVPDRAAEPAAPPEPEPGGPEGTDGVLQVVETPDLEQAIRERRAQPVPAALPVLPLKDMVTYPDTLTPLAVGRQRSMRLVNDVLSGERMLVLVAGRDPELDEPGPKELYDVGVAGDRRPDAQGPRRDDPDPGPGDRAGAARRLRRRGPLPGRTHRAAARRGRAVGGARGAHPQRPAHLLARSSSRSRTCPRSSSSRSPTSTTRRRSPT